jgi:hypothetical protein
MAAMTTQRRFVTGFVTTCGVFLGALAPAHGASRYAPLMASTAGQDSLRNLALWEDQRVTGDGKIFVYLTQGSPLVRRRAVEALGRMQDPSDAAKLIPLLKDPNKEVRREVVFALGQIGNLEAVTPLLAARSGALPDDVALIAEALGKLGNDESVTALDEMQRDFATQVRADATRPWPARKTPTPPTRSCSPSTTPTPRWCGAQSTGWKSKSPCRARARR